MAAEATAGERLDKLLDSSDSIMRAASLFGEESPLSSAVDLPFERGVGSMQNDFTSANVCACACGRSCHPGPARSATTLSTNGSRRNDRRDLLARRCGGHPPPLQAARRRNERRALRRPRRSCRPHGEPRGRGRLAAHAGGGEDFELRAGDRFRWARDDAGPGLINSATAEVAAV